ncbi:dCTP deaminase [Patescibacteria group bacterium]
MFLADKDIVEAIKTKRVKMSPYKRDQVGSVAYDLRLHNNFLVFHNHSTAAIDVKKPFDVTERKKVRKNGWFVIHPGEFILGSTLEVVGLPDDLIGILEGRSSLGRLGLIVHATAGMVKPGFVGHLTLEMSNISKLPIKLYPGMRIGQIAFSEMKSKADAKESEHTKRYLNQEAPAASKIWKDFS